MSLSEGTSNPATPSRAATDSNDIPFQTCPAVEIIRDLEIEDLEAEDTEPRAVMLSIESERRRTLINQRRNEYLSSHGNAGPPNIPVHSYAMYMNQPATQSNRPISGPTRNPGTAGNVAYIHRSGSASGVPNHSEPASFETSYETDFVVRRYTLGNGCIVTIKEPRDGAPSASRPSHASAATNPVERAEESPEIEGVRLDLGRASLGHANAHDNVDDNTVPATASEDARGED